MLMTVSIAAQMIVKLPSTILMRGKIQKLYGDMRQMHVQNGQHPEKRDYLIGIMKLIKVIFRGTFIVYNLSGVSILLAPIITIFSTSRNNGKGTKEYLLPVLFPFVENYWFNAVYHVLCIFTAVYGLWLSDNYLLIKLVHYYANGKLLKISLNDLEKILETDGNNEKLIDLKLHEIYDMHIHMIE